MSAPERAGWARHLLLSGLAGAGAALLLSIWNTDHMLLASVEYRREPGRLVHLMATALLWYLPLLTVVALGLSLSLSPFRKRSSVGEALGIGVALFTAVYGLGIFFGPADSPLRFTRETLTGLLVLGAMAVASGYGAVGLASHALKSARTALLVRGVSGFAAASLAALSSWSLLREAFEFPAGSMKGLLAAGLSLAAGGMAGALVFLLARGGLKVWSRLGSVAGCVLLAGVGLGLVPFSTLMAPDKVAAEANGSAKGRPNVILIVADTLRADRVGVYGASRTRTPAIDALAHGGGRFTDVTATASWTYPTTASILTGLYPSTHGLMTYEDAMRPDAVSIAAVMRRAGYVTAGFVANPVLVPEAGLGEGFDRWHHRMGQSMVSRHRKTALAGALRKLGLWAPEEFFPRAETAIEHSRQWLDRHPEDPFFLYLHLMDPHDPYSPPSPYDAMYGRDPNDEFEMTFGTLPAIQAGRMSVGPEQFESMLSLYDGVVTYMDSQIGRFLRELQDSGRLDNTLVVFVADHGEEFIDHGGLGHEHTLYEELIRVPLIFSGAGVRAGAVIDRAVSQADVAPTILEAVSLRSPVPMEGISLWSALSRGALLPERDIFMEEIYIGQRSPVHYLTAMRRGALKLIGSTFNVGGKGPWKWELYDLEDDPGESVNLLNVHPDAASEMMTALDHHASRPRAGRGDGGPTGDERMELLRSLGYVE